jgi:hypothetical protein
VSYAVDPGNAVFNGEHDDVWKALDQRTAKIAADSAEGLRSFHNQLNFQLHIGPEAIAERAGKCIKVMTRITQVIGDQWMYRSGPIDTPP